MGEYSGLFGDQAQSGLIVLMVRDLERTREYYCGYAYVRTIRNILTGKEGAAIAPLFKDKPYYGQYYRLRLDKVEHMMDALVKEGLLKIIYTQRGKLYCSPEYHDEHYSRCA